MKDVLSENSKKKKEYPKSVTELLRLEEKKCARRLFLRKQHFQIYIKRGKK
jgi:hypothetical protein